MMRTADSDAVRDAAWRRYKTATSRAAIRRLAVTLAALAGLMAALWAVM